mmetsp:Transcript_15404/g.38255  ORF Transcript_15404/g.38255 Transcript_15404/m.38255 type:complete len:902 (-) Transcript_15404:1053-3758(-)
MRDYAQYSSRIPSPIAAKSPRGTTRTKSTPPSKTKAATNSNSPDNDKRESPSNNGNRNSKSSSTFGLKTGGVSLRDHVHQAPSLNASDALSIRRDGPEVTVHRLREQLDEANMRDETAKAALAKSDAIILELRSQQKQIRKQLEVLQQEKAEFLSRGGAGFSNGGSDNKQQQIVELQQQIADLTKRLQDSEMASKKDGKVGELEIQLDKAHAQILTADMVRKELEDTLEAEQYTWELRVQDQDRQIANLQSECDTLAQDLDQCRTQWKEAEKGWNDEVKDLKTQLQQAHASRAAVASSTTAGNDSSTPRGESGSHVSVGSNNRNADELLAKIHQLERERSELQSCLDEALKELEAVDAEMQTEEGGKNDPQMIESLQHLLRWVYQEGPKGESEHNTHNMATDPNVLVNQIQESLEGWLEIISNQGGKEEKKTDDGNDASALQSQIVMYKEELKNREESSAELRESLKEAVALLKPLQDAVAQTEEEKELLERRLQEADQNNASSQQTISQQSREIKSLKEQVSGLGEQLEEQKRLASARNSLLSTPSPKSQQSKGQSTEDSLSRIQRARDELRRKRETEGNLKQLLKDAQSRFHNLHEQNESAVARNRELQGQIDQLGAEDEGLAVSEQIAKRDAEIRNLQEQVVHLQNSPQTSNKTNAEVEELEKQISKLRGDLSQKEHAERVLNKSLKEALGLLKPLQTHLEEAEQEKMEISRELRSLRKRFRQLQMGDTDDFSKSTMGGQDPTIELIKIKEELEETIRQLENENSQLIDALEDLSEAEGSKVHNEARLRQNLVELNSRYEVTQNKLEDAHVENHALTKALKHKEMEELKRNDELRQLKEKLAKTEAEKTKALAIAKASFLKVEELTMASIEVASREEDSTIDVDLAMMEEKASKLAGF